MNYTKSTAVCQDVPSVTTTYSLTLPDLAVLINEIARCDVRTVRRWSEKGFFSEIEHIQCGVRTMFCAASAKEFLDQVRSGQRVIGKAVSK